MMKKIVLLCLVLALNNNLSFSQAVLERIEPEFTTTDRLMLLSKGMNKTQVFDVLGVYPYDVFYSSESGCETHMYKVSVTRRLHSRIVPKEGTIEQLSFGTPYNDSLRNMIVYFTDGLFVGFVAPDRERRLYDILAMSEDLKRICAKPEPNGPQLPIVIPFPVNIDKREVEGCMDSLSINFNPDATVDNGDCRYCDCGFEPAKRTEVEIKAGCPPCLPSKELWSIWLTDGRCDLIRSWVYKYPPLVRRLPGDYLKSKDCEAKVESRKDCDWCDVIERSADLNKVTFEINTKK
jgi:hypothetical protein